VDNPKDVEIGKKIAPALVAFTNAMADAGLMASALIFDESGEFLVRAGNAPHRGVAFVKLHTYLSLVITQLEQMGVQTDLSVVEAEGAPNSQPPAEIALKLALACITCPSDLIPSRVSDLARQYLDAVGE
jgi:hypothetical protein